MKLLEIVHFTDTGERRMVLGFCKTCERARDEPPDPEHNAFTVVSPMGTAHTGRDYGMTGCGRDATGTDWWWAE